MHSRARIAAEVFLSILAFALFAFAILLSRTWFEDHLTQAFCANEPAQLHRLIATRGGVVCLGLALLFGVRPIVGKWIARQTLKSALGSSLRIVLAVALALAVSAIILRPKKELAPTLGPGSLPPIHFEPELGWTGEPNARVTLPADDRQIPYVFDDEGNRVASPDSHTDPDAPSILFAGESITVGTGVRFEEAYPALVGANLHLQSVEAAVHGYAIDQIYSMMLRQLAKLHHPVAVVTFMIPELLERSLDHTRPRLVLGLDGALVRIPADPPMADWWKNSPLRKVAHGIFPYHDDSAIALARAIFVATAKEARARGAYPLVVYTNWNSPCLPPDPGTPTQTERLFTGLDVPWIHVSTDPTSMEHTTHHPTPPAHRVLADAIEKALIEAKVAAK